MCVRLIAPLAQKMREGGVYISQNTLRFRERSVTVKATDLANYQMNLALT